jgi:hypothetical protein
MADEPSYPGMPGWVKAGGIVVILIVLLVVILKLTGIGGHHGPGRHFKSSSSIGQPKVPEGGERQGP